MNYYNPKHLLLLSQGIILFLLSSCSNQDEAEVKHSFTAAINVKQSIEEFDKVKFESFDNLNLGFFKGEIWIKLDIKNGNNPNSYMVINNDYINRNYIFYKHDSLTNSFKLVNPLKHISNLDYRTYNISNPNFKIDLNANEQATYVIATTVDGRTVDATPTLISMEKYSDLTTENVIWSTVFFGVIIFLLFLNIYQWSIHKQSIYFYYIFYIIATFIMYLGLEGKLFSLGFKQIIDHIVFLSIRLWVLSLIIFTAKFLKIDVSFPGFYRFIKYALLIVLGGVTLYQLVFYNTSIAHLHYFENLLSFVWLVLLLGIILASAKTRKLELRYYLIPLSCLLFFVTMGLIDGHFQVLPGSPFIYIKTGTIVEFFGFTYFMSVLIKRKLKMVNSLEYELQENREELNTISKVLKEKDKIISSKTAVEKTDLIGIFNLLENSLSTEIEWDEFKLKLEELNPIFLEQLLVNHPNLSKSEIRLLTLIRIGYTQKEIATILSIAPDSVKKAKSRVRKKLGLTEATSLHKYFLSIEK
jgi:DNA-binding CsgD family transcriptional regulator